MVDEREEVVSTVGFFFPRDLWAMGNFYLGQSYTDVIFVYGGP